MDTIRAKSKKYGRYLLKEHIEDITDRIIQIWNFVQKNQNSIDYDFVKSKKIFKNLTKAAFLHDLGKIDYGFQKKVFEKDEKVGENEEWSAIRDFFTVEKYPTDFGVQDHEILSIIHTVAFLENNEWNRRIRTAILLHHYNKFFAEREQHITRILDDYPSINDYIKFLISKKNQFRRFYEDLMDYIENRFRKKDAPQFIYDAFNELKNNMDIDKFEYLYNSIENGFGISNILPLYELYDKNFEDLKEFFIFLGLFRRCDYSASGGVNAEQDVCIEDVMKNLPWKIKQNIEFHPSKIWQEEILDKYKDEKNLIMIAPTGSGKTEFALLWARNNGKKLLYTLPLRVALNDLFIRFTGDNGYFDRKTADLLHSTAFIEYLKGENKNEDVSVDEKLKEIKMLTSPILLATPDQIFLSSLKFYGFDKLLSVYPFSSIVIDEIQAYDPEMAAIIIKTLQMVEKTNGNILIITATFPPYYKEFLRKYSIIDLEKEKDSIQQEIKNYNLKRHKIELINDTIFFKDENKDWKIKSFDKITKLIDRHPTKNILIIVNNVMKAIKLFEQLNSDQYSMKHGKNVYLIHSRLIEKEKSKRIEEIKNFLRDKREKKIPEDERIIVISTQIVEASVDFDFDVIVTEISPIDSQVQRWGRVYRNRRENYEGDANIYIFTGLDEGTKAIYKPEMTIKKTIEVLQQKIKDNAVLGYEDERKLVLDVYNDENIKDLFHSKIREMMKWIDIYQASKKSDAQKIFRRIAGVQLIIPEIMRMYNSDESLYLETLAEIIKNPEKRDISWKKVAEEIFGENKKNNVLKVLKWMYEYSAPVPEYIIEKHLFGAVKEFNGFYILDLKDEDAEKVKKLGVDVVNKIDLDEYLDNIII